MIRVLLLLALALATVVALAQAPSISFSFTIPSGPDLRTSAAVLDNTGTMVRTLWGNVKLPPGTYTRQWDGTFDQGGTATTGNTYTIKLLMNNVSYTYDSLIGDTGNWKNTPNVWGRFAVNGLTRIVWIGTTAWFTPGYSEGLYNFGLFQRDNPNSPYPASLYYRSLNLMSSDIATDGTWIYIPTRQYNNNDPVFVFAIDAASGQPVQFTNSVQSVGNACAIPGCSGAPPGTYNNMTLSTIDQTTYSTTGSITSLSKSLSVADGGGYINGSNVFVTGAGPFVNGSYQTLSTTIASGGGVTGPTTLQLTASASTTVNNQTVSYGIPLSGIAVQRTGNILAVAHGIINQIVLFDKRIGSSLGTITGITNPTQMAFNAEGLWVVSNGALYEVTGVGSSNTVTAVSSLGGITFSNVVSVAVNKATDSLFILDGGTNQQAYEFAVTTHSLMRTYGVLGGYNDCNPTITNARLNVDNYANYGAMTPNGSFVSADDNDELWIGDSGTAMRVLHISAANKYVNQIISPHYIYHAIVSETLPTRLFLHKWEYAINYGVPNNPGDPDPALGGNGAWQLVKNWGVCAEGGHGSPSGLFIGPTGGIVNVEQLSNGRVYAEIQSRSPGYTHIFELPLNGTSPARDTGVNALVSGATGGLAMMLRNGNLVYPFNSGTYPNYIVTIYQATQNGFDANYNPLYTPYAVVASATTTSLTSSLRPGGGWSMPYYGVGEATTSGYYPVNWGAGVSNYNANATTNYPHLGAIKSGFTSYAWTTLGEVCFKYPDYLGNWPCSNGYGSHNGIAPVKIEGQNVFTGYDGQNVTWGSQFYHFWEDGLLVGQFGNTEGWLYVSGNNGFQQTFRPRNGENIGDISTTVANGDIYFYHPDEAPAACHRWHISNLASIHEWSGSGTLQPNGTVTLAQVFTTSPTQVSAPTTLPKRKHRIPWFGRK